MDTCMVHREALAAKKMPVLFDSCWTNPWNDKSHQITSAKLSLVWGPLPGDGVRARTAASAHWSSLALQGAGVYSGCMSCERRWSGFLTEIKSDLVKHLDDTMWLASLSYLVDIFDRLNGLNLSLQGRETHILLLADKLHAFTQKLDLWHGRISRGNCDMFPSLADFITDAGTSHDFSSLFQSASEHLSAMRKQFATYFKEDYRSFAWVRDPFVCTANELSIDMQEQLIELKSDSRLKELFSSCPLSSFWAALMQEYPELCDVALKIPPSFASTYLCEAGFLKNDCTQNEIPQSCTNRGWFEAMFIKHWAKIEGSLQGKAGSGLTLTSPTCKHSLKKCKWCLLLGLVIITIIKHKLISEVWCQFPIIAIA